MVELKISAKVSAKERKRKEWPRVREAVNNGAKVWLVDARRDGQGKRYFYTTAAEADAKAEQLRIQVVNEGTAALSMPLDLRAEAIECHEKLKAAGATLREATAFFLKHAKPAGGERTVAELVSEFLAAKTKAGRRDTYLDVQRYVLENVFAGKFGARQVREVSSSEIEEWMEEQNWAMRTRLNYYRDLGNLLGFAQRRGYVASNAIGRIERPKVKGKPPGVLTVDEAKALLMAAAAREDGLLPAVAIGLFCGLRTAEIKRLDWKHVRLDHATVEVTAENAKMSERRLVDMPENLPSWLKPYLKDAGPVAPVKSFDWRLAECAKAAGIKWPKNAMRHSFASYHFAHHKNASLTMALLGHFGNARTFVGSYRGLVQPKDAAAFWALTPG